MSISISRAQQMVAEFHRCVRVLERAELSRHDGTSNILLQATAEMLKAEAQTMEGHCSAPRALRTHLMVEELGEVIGALTDADELELLDGLADLLYVLLGTAAIYDLPLEAAFEEVHRSNMTKEKQPDDPGAARVRQKGPNYKAPDLARVLREHKEKTCPATT